MDELVFDDMDANKDGMIDKPEFMDYMRKMMRGKFVEMVKATMSGAAKE
jgi:Ca2+-binding EF-hand superfamily protein